MNAIRNYDEVLDARYGVPGTPEREAFTERAFEYVRELVGDEEFFKMTQPTSVAVC